MQLDDADLRILKALQQDARLSLRQLASDVNLTSTPVYERLKRLEKSGIITGYHARIDPDKIDMGFTVFCNIKLSKINTEIHRDFAAMVDKIPQIAECYNISGQWDYMLKVRVKDMGAYRSLVTDTLGRFPYLSSLESVFVMEPIKQQQDLPL